jgi:hypothetical protein
MFRPQLAIIKRTSQLHLLILRYSPLWALASLITAFQLSLSCAFFHKAVTFKMLRSSNTSSSHLNFGLFLYYLLAGARLISSRVNFHPSFWYALATSATSVCLFLLIELYLVLWIIYIIYHYILFSILHLHSLGHRFSLEFFLKIVFSLSLFTSVSVRLPLP